MTESMLSLQDVISQADTTVVVEQARGMLATFQEMDNERLNFSGTSMPLQIILGFVMFGVALGIKGQHFSLPAI